MKKQTPEDALYALRTEVDSEIIKSRRNEKKGTKAFTAIFMSEQTYMVLKKSDDGYFFTGTAELYEHYTESLGVKISASLACPEYNGYVVIKDSLGFGKVVLKRYYMKL